MHHPKVVIECLYIKWENDGRELIQLELTYKTTTIGLKKYLDTTTDWMLQFVNAYKKQKKKYSICKVSNRFANQLDFTLKEIDIKDKAIEFAKNIKKEAKT